MDIYALGNLKNKTNKKKGIIVLIEFGFVAIHPADFSTQSPLMMYFVLWSLKLASEFFFMIFSLTILVEKSSQPLDLIQAWIVVGASFIEESAVATSGKEIRHYERVIPSLATLEEFESARMYSYRKLGYVPRFASDFGRANQSRK